MDLDSQLNLMNEIEGLSRENIPKHIAVIMDGNGRWACQRSMPRNLGHREGMRAVRCVVESSAKLGVGVLTLYAFSEENWGRPALEVDTIMALIREFVGLEKDRLNKNNISLKVIGNINKIPENTRNVLFEAQDLLNDNTGMQLVVALSYGGRQELVDAIKEIVKEVQLGLQSSNCLDQSTVEKHLYTYGLPDPDLLIRTSGEQRISNLLLWQMAYTEFYFTDTLWPDFDVQEFKKAIEEFQNRKRRYGGVVDYLGATKIDSSAPVNQPNSY